jgi:hypothetical protein
MSSLEQFVNPDRSGRSRLSRAASGYANCVILDDGQQAFVTTRIVNNLDAGFLETPAECRH